MRLVIILWIDSTEQYGWNEQHDLPQVAECTTVGFLVSETDHQVVIASSRGKTNGNLNGVIAIPKVAISERVSISEDAE